MKIEAVLSEISKYSLEDKEIVLDLLKKRLIDERREEIYRDYERSRKNYKKGKVKRGKTEVLWNSVNS